MSSLPLIEILDVLEPAYGPWTGFVGKCESTATWRPHFSPMPHLLRAPLPVRRYRRGETPPKRLVSGCGTDSEPWQNAK